MYRYFHIHWKRRETCNFNITILSKFSSRRHILLHNMQNPSMKSALHIRNKIIYKPHHEKPCFCKKKKTKAQINCAVSTPLFNAFVFV